LGGWVFRGELERGGMAEVRRTEDRVWEDDVSVIDVDVTRGDASSGNLQVTGVNLLELERITWSWSNYLRLTWSWSSYLRLPDHLVYLDSDSESTEKR
jgi:hypothetical protein